MEFKNVTKKYNFYKIKIGDTIRIYKNDNDKTHMDVMVEEIYDTYLVASYHDHNRYYNVFRNVFYNINIHDIESGFIGSRPIEVIPYDSKEWEVLL